MLLHNFRNIAPRMARVNPKNLYLYIIASLCVALIVFYILFIWFMWEPAIKGRSNLVDRYGGVVGFDFSHYYSASFLALNGKPALAYNSDILQALIQHITGVKFKEYAYLYPPTFLLIILPLSLFPYPGCTGLLAFPYPGWLLSCSPKNCSSFSHTLDGSRLPGNLS